MPWILVGAVSTIANIYIGMGLTFRQVPCKDKTELT